MESSAAQRLKANQNVKVYVRVRPTNARERNIRSMEVVEVPSNKDVVIHQSTDSRTTKKFSFDRAFGPDSKQNEVYHTVVAPMIEEVLAGYNCTVFAYGQTGTGKTHTMVGEEAPELNTAWDDDSDLGIIPRALSHLFDELRMREVEFTMRVSYLELYNEELCDLLSTDDTVKIRIFDDATKKGSVIVQGLEEIPVHSKDDVYKLLAKGQERRRTACTLMNAQSSRSHTIFSILVHIKENGIEGEDMLKIGKLNLVDLAGSENISKAGNEKGARTRETVNINQSLLTLGRVITALVERGPHIPYRESKLTRLLQESLGGRTKTAIIATISPGHKDLEETLSTLDYAHRAKNIQNKPEINQRLTKKTVLKEYTEEIDRLKRDLIAARDKNGIYLAEDTYNQMTFQLDSQTRELNEKIMIIRALKDEMTKKQELFKEVSLNLIECTNELKHTESKLTTTKVVLNQAKQVLVKTKRRYDEKKKIIEHHVETEQQLTSQANNIISVADVAVKHTDHLHKAIVRHRDTHETAKSVCDKFANTMNQRFVSMSSSMDEFVKFSSKTTQEIEDELNESVVTNNKRLAAIKRHINKVEEVATESTDLINITLNAYQSKTKEWSSAQRDTLHAILVDIVIEKDKCIEKFQSMTEYFKNKSRESLEAVEQYRQWIQTHQLRTSTFCHDHVATLQRTSSDLNAFFQTMGNEFTQNVDESEAIAAKTQELIDEMNRLQQRKLTNHANMRKLISTIDGEKSKNSSTLQAHSTTISEYNQNQQTSHEIGAMLAESLHTITDSCTEHAITSVEPNSDLDVCLQTNVQDLIAKAQFEINNGCSALDSQLCVLVETAAKQGVDNNDQLMEHTNALSLESEHSIEFLSSKLTLLNSCNKHLTQSVQELDATSKEHITIAQHALDEFKHKEMPVYKPSGETPVRRNFSYPRELASTSPHDRIISRVRLENEWSDLDTTAPEFELDDTLDSTTDTLENVTEEGIQPLSDISKEFSLNIPLQNMGLKSANSTPNSFSTMNEFNKENTITQE